MKNLTLEATNYIESLNKTADDIKSFDDHNLLLTQTAALLGLSKMLIYLTRDLQKLITIIEKENNGE